jgi:hypothetical protein
MQRQLEKLAILLLWVMAPAMVLAVNANAPSARSTEQEWNFKVYLDESAIGYHHFRLSQEQDHQLVETEAEFQVKFLFVTAYRYEHENTEIWKGECLQQIESHTDANGKLMSVRGNQVPEGFQLNTAESSKAVAGCVKTFAYWDPRFLEESALLNSQTGEIIPVQIEPLGQRAIRAQGREVEALGYRMRGKNLDMQIWYSLDRQWLGLESTIKGGRTLRYELI